MSRLTKLLMSVILLVFFNSCSSDAFLFPVRHELRKLEVVEATLINYLENEAKLLQRFNVNSQNVFFIEQKIPWWKLGRPSTTLIRELADKFYDQFIVCTIQNVLWEDITYGDTVCLPKVSYRHCTDLRLCLLKSILDRYKFRCCD